MERKESKEFDDYGGCIDIHPDFRIDTLAHQHELDPRHYWLRGLFRKDGTIQKNEWRTYYTSSYRNALNGELVDPHY